MESFIFLLCDAVHSVAYAMARICLSVCHFVCCLEMARHVLKLFH